MANSVTDVAGKVTFETATVVEFDRAANNFMQMCLANTESLPLEATQQVLSAEGHILAQEMFEVLRKYVERRSKMIVRRVTINRDLTPEQMIAAAKRKQYITDVVLATMPRQGTGIEADVDMYFFPAERELTIDEQEAALAAYGLVPDYYGQVQVNIDDPSFADEHWNGAQWDNKDGEASYVTFSRNGDERSVVCDRRGNRWGSYYWFAGRLARK